MLWERLIYRVVTGVFPNTHIICGVRMIDKTSTKNDNEFRVEVWVKLADEKI